MLPARTSEALKVQRMLEIYPSDPAMSQRGRIQSERIRNQGPCQNIKDPKIGSQLVKANPYGQGRINLLDPTLDPPFGGSCGPLFGSLWPLCWFWASAVGDINGNRKRIGTTNLEQPLFSNEHGRPDPPPGPTWEAGPRTKYINRTQYN